MIGLLQRVSRAAVIVDDRTIGKIDRGLLVLVGVEKDDTQRTAEKLAERLRDSRGFAAPGRRWTPTPLLTRICSRNTLPRNFPRLRCRMLGSVCHRQTRASSMRTDVCVP